MKKRSDNSIALWYRQNTFMVLVTYLNEAGKEFSGPEQKMGATCKDYKDHLTGWKEMFRQLTPLNYSVQITHIYCGKKLSEQF